MKMMPFLPRNSVLVFDRGYPSYELFREFEREPLLDFLFRCPTTSNFPAVMKFMASGQKEALLLIEPSYEFRRRNGQGQGEPVLVRAIKMVKRGRKVSLLLTSILDSKTYPAQDIIALYEYRWAVEDYYRHEKTYLKIEAFHSRTANGVIQELFSAVIMSVLAGILRVTAMSDDLEAPNWPQVKHSIISIASEAAFLVSDLASSAWDVFMELLEEIKRVRYYKPKQKKASQPRVSKQPKNKWISDRAKKMALYKNSQDCGKQSAVTALVSG